MTSDEDRPLIDFGQAPLCLGAAGHVHATIRPDGTTEYWIITANGDSDDRHRTPQHEHEGPLPASILASVHAHRCGAERVDGGRCRQHVPRPGALCRHHNHGAALIQRILGGHVVNPNERKTR